MAKCASTDSCSKAVADACAEFGVGSPLWPVGQWHVSKEAFDTLGREKVDGGKKCIQNHNWSQKEFRDWVGTMCKNDPWVVKKLEGFNQ
jgi:hypothetical protein